MIEGIDRRIVIVGGGPAGLYSAYLIKKDNPNTIVTVYEDHEDVGEPVCCSGLIGINGFNKTNLKNYVSVKDFLVNTIKGADIYGIHKTKFEINASTDNAYVIDRSKFDKKLKQLAQSVGVEVVFSSRVTEVKENFVIVNNLKTNETKEVRFEFLIGSDGPNSIVRKKIVNKELNQEFIHAYQVVVEGSFNKEKVQLYFGDFAKGLFAWVIPESSTTARIGIGTCLGKNNPKSMFYEFKSKFNINYANEVSNCSGMLPISKPLTNFVSNNMLIVGDAACFVKATTGGGINFGLISAEMAAKAITGRIKKFTKLSAYNSYLSKYVKELKLHYKIRRYILSKNNIELDDLLKKFRDAEVNKFLEAKGDMDYPSVFVTKLLTNYKFFKLFPEIIRFFKS